MSTKQVCRLDFQVDFHENSCDCRRSYGSVYLPKPARLILRSPLRWKAVWPSPRKTPDAPQPTITCLAHMYEEQADLRPHELLNKAVEKCAAIDPDPRSAYLPPDWLSLAKTGRIR